MGNVSIIGAFIVPHPPLIVPDIGRGEEKKIEKTINGYDEVARRIRELRPETIVLSSPHSIMYQDYIHVSPGKKAMGSFSGFGAGHLKFEVEYDRELVNAIENVTQAEGFRAGTMGERNPALDHGTMVPLYFINKYFREYQLVRMGISGLSYADHYRFGMLLKMAIEKLNRRVVYVASGDLSHKLKADGPYGLAPEGSEFDRIVTSHMASGDFGGFLDFDEVFCEKAAECGLRSFIMMAGALDGQNVEPELLSYEGPFGVGYAVGAFRIGPDDVSRKYLDRHREKEKKRLDDRKMHEDKYVSLARTSLEHYILNGKRMSLPSDLDRELLENRAGVFVSLKIDGRLRGCIGTIEATTDCIGKEIIQNAISAGTKDPRFDPVKMAELTSLEYSVDVLKQSERISSISELDPERYGVIVACGNRQGLLLPKLEGIDTPEEQVEIALRKAGIREDEPYVLARFEVIRHH